MKREGTERSRETGGGAAEGTEGRTRGKHWPQSAPGLLSPHWVWWVKLEGWGGGSIPWIRRLLPIAAY